MKKTTPCALLLILFATSCGHLGHQPELESSNPVTPTSQERDFDLIGQLSVGVHPKDATNACVMNAVFHGPDGFGHPVLADISHVNVPLRQSLFAANLKWVGLNGTWKQQPDKEFMFLPSTVTVLDTDFHLTGQVVRYEHPDGSMVHITHAIVTSSGMLFPLSFFPERHPAQELRVGGRYKLYGSFKQDGHKGFLLSFGVKKIEEITNQASEAIGAEAAPQPQR